MAGDRRRSSGTAGAGAIRVTWARSTIGHTAATRGTIRALGLRRLHQTVEVADTPENRGMLRRVAFLLDVAESGAEAGGRPREAAPQPESARGDDGADTTTNDEGETETQ